MINSIFAECFSGVQLGHVQLLDFKGISTACNFDWHWAVFDSRFFRRKKRESLLLISMLLWWTNMHRALGAVCGYCCCTEASFPAMKLWEREWPFGATSNQSSNMPVPEFHSVRCLLSAGVCTCVCCFLGFLRGTNVMQIIPEVAGCNYFTWCIPGLLWSWSQHEEPIIQWVHDCLQQDICEYSTQLNSWNKPKIKAIGRFISGFVSL